MQQAETTTSPPAESAVGPSREQLRILFVCQNDFAAATEKQVLGYAEELIARGHRVMITIGRELATAAAEGVDGIPGLLVRRHTFKGPWLRRSDIAAYRDFAPNVVHAFNSRVPTVAALRQIARATGAAACVHFEDDEWRPPPQAFPGESRHLPLSRFLRRRLWPLYPRLWWQSSPASLRWVRRHADGLDALTPVLAAEVETRMGRKCAVVLPITPRHIAVDSDGAAPILEPGTSRVVLFTGTILPVYLPDVRLGMRAAAQARRRGHDVIFVHAGHTFGFDPELLAAEEGLAADATRFVGFLPFRAVPGLLAQADVLLQSGPPSEFNRLRLPSKLQTYLASGTPTITFAVGAGELLVDREEVVKTYTAEPDELADRIIDVLTDPDLEARLRRGGPAAAARLFDPVANTDALLGHYRAVLAARACQRAR